MPLLKFECGNCGRQFEELTSSTTAVCDACGKEAVRCYRGKSYLMMKPEPERRHPCDPSYGCTNCPSYRR